MVNNTDAAHQLEEEVKGAEKEVGGGSREVIKRGPSTVTVSIHGILGGVELASNPGLPHSFFRSRLLRKKTAWKAC